MTAGVERLRFHTHYTGSLSYNEPIRDFSNNQASFGAVSMSCQWPEGELA